MIYIYTLTDPRTNEIKYVGKTNDIKKRYRNHIQESIKGLKKTHKHCWIRSLLNINIKPIIDILEEYDGNDWEWLEIMWIGIIKSWGFNLTNIGDGG